MPNIDPQVIWLSLLTISIVNGDIGGQPDLVGYVLYRRIASGQGPV